jgi:hypothetical protein
VNAVADPVTQATYEDVSFRLYAKQMKVLTSPATEILYGGAAGGGKSYLMRVMAILICLEVQGAIVYIFRRLFKELLANHVYGVTGFLTILKPFIDDGLVIYNKSEQYILFTETGSRIFLAHCQHEDDVLSYLGADFHVLLIDEASQFTEKMLRFLRSRVRLGALNIPPKWKGLLPKILYGTNPRGPAHGYLKRGFVDISQGIDHIWQAEQDDGGMLRQFIPALYTDNLVQMQNDPGYLGRLRGLGSKDLTDAYEKGDWAVREDAIFGDIYDEAVHLIDPFAIPAEWPIDRGYDHGETAPASSLWFAETNGESVALPDGRLFSPPARSIIVINELYFATADEKGLKLDPGEMGRRIREYEIANAMMRTRPGPADHSIFDAAPGYRSVADMMAPHVKYVRADKTPGSRKRGVTYARQMLTNRAQRKAEPWLCIFKTCVKLNAHMKNLPRDEEDPDDVSTLAVDHDWDVLKYRLLRAKAMARQIEVEGT